MVPLTGRKPALIGKYQTILDGRTVPYAVKRSSRAKYVRLEVRIETGLTVVIPSSYNVEQLPDFLRKKGRWILDQLAKYVEGQPITDGKEISKTIYVPKRVLNIVEK